jgi:predicted dehydrogenase
MVGFNRRCSSHGQKAQAFFAAHKEPLVMAFRVNAGALPVDHWIQEPTVGGGRIIGEACHFIDYMQFVCNAKPVAVHARRIGHHSSGVTDDQSLLSFTFADGSIGTIIYAAGGDTALAKERFEVFGDGKSLVMDDFMVSEFYHRDKRNKFKSGKRDKGFQNEMAQFANVLIKGTPPLMTFEDIQAVTRASILAVKSFQTGQNYNV